jgi:tRNA A-37 threonylcarbamoyl transferase component Bud32
MASADPMQPALAVGTEIAGYRVEAFISRGGMAVVYRGHDRRLGRRVALKLLAPELSQDERFQQRFLRESRLAASLDHPNIVPIYEAGEASGLLYIVMRYVEGSDLRALLDREGPLDLARTISIMRQVGAALDAAHARGLVHRDVKPGNILIASGTGREDPDHVYLTDFGLTKRSSSLSGQTTTGRFIGTMDYVAPEQIGGKPVDARTDVYSLGCVLYECLVGEPPFDRDDEAALLWAHLVEHAPRVSARRPDLPAGLDAVLDKAMAKAPDDRYGACLDLIRDFRAEVEGKAGPPPAPVPPAAADAHPRRDDGGWQRSVPSATMSADKIDTAVRRLRGRRPPRILALAGVLVLVLAVAAVLFVRSREESLSNSFVGNNLVPFSFRYPGGWQQEGQEVQVVFSPRAGELLPLFSRLADGWDRAGPVVDQHPSEAVGLFTFFGTTRLDGATVEEIRQHLQALLPQEVRFSQAHDRALVGGYLADRLEGSLRDPRNQAAVLRFECYVVHVQPPQAKSVFLVYFSSSADFDSRKELFARITGSVDFLS